MDYTYTVVHELGLELKDKAEGYALCNVYRENREYLRKYFAGLREMFARRFRREASNPKTKPFTRIDINLTFFGAWSMVADKKKQIREITELE